MQLFIRDLWIYPVKSLGGVAVADAAITPAGSLVHDREWLVVDREGRMVWQGDIPLMTLVRVALDAHALSLSMDGTAPLRLPLDHGGPAVTVTMYKRDFPGIDAGDEAAAWLSTMLGQPLRLVRIGAAAHKWDGSIRCMSSPKAPSPH